MDLDVVIFGGGTAGLWLLDELHCRGDRVLLLEADALGSGQTIASQGILHGGLKYTLQGLLTESAAAIREMPALWRDALEGQRGPDLTDVRVRSQFCHLWRTRSLSSRLGMIGAKLGLRVAPTNLTDDERPPLLQPGPGTVARLDEQIIAPQSFVQTLADAHRERILKIDAERGLHFECTSDATVQSIQLTDPRSRRTLTLRPRTVVFAAGAGNAALRRAVGLNSDIMQRRPLHMVLVRGHARELPAFNGHCVDGAQTRVTITADSDGSGRTIWQLGGRIAEAGVDQNAPALIAHAKQELEAVLPGVDVSNTEWSTYRVDRAEMQTPQGKRPESVQIIREGNCITAWPTKLVLAPQLARQILADLPLPAPIDSQPIVRPNPWANPVVALPPWETATTWSRPGLAFLDFPTIRGRGLRAG